MVVHKDSHNITTVIPAVKMSHKESKTFLVVNNHVREIPIQYGDNTTPSKKEENADENMSNKRRKRLITKSIKKTPKAEIKKHSENSDNSHEDLKISYSDLEELRTVYKNCKAVIKKIELKYGHLLDLECEASGSTQKRLADQEIEECRCETNKKIVFDDDGKQITVDATTEIHICPKKTKTHHQTIEIEYNEDNTQLPDSLQELFKLLQNPDIHNTIRHKVLYKIRSIKEEISNEIKFNKHSLMEKLKSNPDEILAFEGTNLASLPGYI